MSDLIFRGVKNPANCSECFFWAICHCLADFDDYSAILDAVHDGNLVRHEECPIVPLPEGCGRLIDADAFEDAFIRYYLSQERSNHLVFTAVEIKQHFADMIADFQTIVPAEGGGQ